MIYIIFIDAGLEINGGILSGIKTSRDDSVLLLPLVSQYLSGNVSIANYYSVCETLDHKRLVCFPISICSLYSISGFFNILYALYLSGDLPRLWTKIIFNLSLPNQCPFDLCFTSLAKYRLLKVDNKSIKNMYVMSKFGVSVLLGYIIICEGIGKFSKLKSSIYRKLS